MIPYNQLSLADIFAVCQEIYESDKPQFLSLLQHHIDLDEIVPASFRKHFYASTGRSRKYPLNAFYGRSSSSGSFPSQRIPFSLSFSAILAISANSAALTRFLTPLKLPVSNRTSLMTSKLSLRGLLILLSQSARKLTLPKPTWRSLTPPALKHG